MVAIIYICLTLLICLGISRVDTLLLLSVYGLLFTTYIYVSKKIETPNYLNWILLGVGLRMLLIFTFPNLSDDIYRFVWDGRLLLQGINPFNQLPSYYIENHVLSSSLNIELYQKLNSPMYYTVYPPLCQASFWLGAWISPDSIYWHSVTLKVFLFTGECASIWWLHQLARQQYIRAEAAVLYALNPLAIIEICGNVHYEGAMIAGLIGAIYFLRKAIFESQTPSVKSLILSALLLSLSISSKMLPLLMLPMFFFIFNQDFINKINIRNIKTGVSYCTLVLLFLAIQYLAFINDTFLAHFQNSLNLYYSKFEFNASIYYVAKQIGYWTYGYNPINNITACLKLVLLFFIAILSVSNRIFFTHKLLIISTLYLLLSSTIHPWYVLLPFAMSLLTQSRFATYWTGLCFLSYSHYYGGQYQEHYWLMTVEYSLLFFFIIKEYNFLHKQL